MTYRPRIKICGITNLEDARYCAGAGADYLGFVQHAPSPRYIEPDVAREIINWLHGPEMVGVFVNESAETVNKISEKAGFDLVQASGTESPEWCGDIEKPVIKTIHVSPEDSADTLLQRMEPYGENVAHFLLDAGKHGIWGGTGEHFQWSILEDDRWESFELFVAGGLNPGNIGRLLEVAEPFAIDMASGLEEAPGRKDYRLVSELFERVAPLT